MPSQYDKIPISCCSCCLSIDETDKIEIDGKIISVCRHCGSDKMQKMTIEAWNNKFERKYGLGPYIRLPKEMTWDEIMKHENKETHEEENIRREIRNSDILKKIGQIKK